MKNTARLSKTISASLAIFILLTLIFAVSFFAVSDCTVAYAAEKKYIFIPYDGALKDLQTAKQSSYIFYSNSESDGFYLPQTYYVELISGVDNGQNYYECKYRGISGKINKHEVLTNNIVSASELSNYTSFVEYPQLSLTPINDTVNTGFSDTFSKAEYSFYYLGEATTSQPDNNNRQIAVLISSKNSNDTTVKTITANQFESFTVPLHPITEKAKQDAIGSGGADGTLNPEGTVSNPALRALLIAGIVVPALILVIMIFIPRKKKDNYDRFVQRRGGSPYDEPKQPYMSNVNSRYRRGGDDRYDYRDGQGYYPDDRDYNSRGYRDARDADYSGDQRYNYDDRRANDYYPDDYDRRDRRYR